MKIFEIYHHDDDVLVVEKLQPFLSQNSDDEKKEGLGQFISRQLKTDIFPVHRLDRDVLGLMIFAKNKKATEHLSNQFKNREIKKIYRAVLSRPMPSKEGRLIHWLQKNSKKNYVTVFPRETPGAKKAELSYRVIGDHRRGQLVEVELHTGRPHQIRAQFAKEGCALVGDTKYSKEATDGPIFLKSVCLGFVHPRSKQWLEISLGQSKKEFEVG